jgi:site-specific recombinase XerC
MDSGAGLANATVQQRIVAVRSFYEFLVEDGPARAESGPARTVGPPWQAAAPGAGPAG